jgi:hypothetical protein
LPSDTPRFASPDDVEDEAAGWPNDFLECRLYGHVWRPNRATFNRTLRYYYVVQACSRCHSERHSELDQRGRVTAVWMRYAEGYLTKKIGRIIGDAKDSLRLIGLGRVYEIEYTRKTSERPHSKHTREQIGLAE